MRSLALPFLKRILAIFVLAGLGGCGPGGSGDVKVVDEPGGRGRRLRELDFTPFEGALAGLSEERAGRITRLIQASTVSQLQSLMREGEVTSEELVLVFLRRIRRYDGHLRSYIELNPRCLDEARAADRLRLAGDWKGLLHGIPINLKDNIGTVAPMHTTAGAEILLNHSPGKEALLVTQLREAGVVVLGKAALSELAGALTTEPPGYNAVSGIGVNPYGDELPVSGSSSGSAISTGAALTMVSVGTETSGSLISPCSMNGVVGMKPSRGVVSGDGVVPLIRFQDSAGPVARNVADAAVLLAAMDLGGADYAGGLNSNALEGVEVGVLRSGILAKGDAAQQAEWLVRIDDGLRRAKAVSRDVGETFEGKPELLPVIFLGLSQDTVGYMSDAGMPVRTVADLKAYNEASPNTRVPRGQNMLDLAARVLAGIVKETGTAEGGLGAMYEEAGLEARAGAAALLAKTFEEHQVEVLVSLSNAHSDVYATAGYPAITVPLGLIQKGAPNGVTLIGKAGDDAKLLAYAYAFEQATRYRQAPESTLD
jgi:amidase